MKSIFLILTLLTLVCCSPAGEPKPANLLSEDQMTRIMMDVHLAEAQVENAGLPLDSGEAVFRKMQQQIFKKHGVKEADFNTSYQYYLRNLNGLDKIYEKIIDSLTVRETLLKAQPPKQ
ncbi:DUF4296 domain-containing protein [Adhaeribacter pallidiroseus]|uniref:DUF4296 domain-containing protein n=1 Tax=Adhaeribacter pallidiroseus TaxID=2072847 RepID=A0A369QGE2_9BACT|nr:DUF4296 domain-containing protein [Adhaeribacter pallidiroseus]RDC62615.1 hypothetical protein AHMF7616_01209 [Adhaeribacter pallidiroseus]